MRRQLPRVQLDRLRRRRFGRLLLEQRHHRQRRPGRRHDHRGPDLDRVRRRLLRPTASPAPEASGNPRTDTKTDASTDSGKSDAPKDSDKSDASDTFTVDESNAHVEIPAGTKTVVINGSNNHIEGKAVSEITINGSANAVEVKSASKVSFTGSNNAVQYKDGNAPQVGSDSGANNVVSKDN